MDHDFAGTSVYGPYDPMRPPRTPLRNKKEVSEPLPLRDVHGRLLRGHGRAKACDVLGGRSYDGRFMSGCSKKYLTGISCHHQTSERFAKRAQGQPPYSGHEDPFPVFSPTSFRVKKAVFSGPLLEPSSIPGDPREHINVT